MDNQYINKALRTESNDYAPMQNRLQDLKTIRLLHGALGLTTEAGEFADGLKKHVFYGKVLDVANLKEEMGDIFWYMALIANTLDIDFSSIMETNIKKLEARYKIAFSENEAEDRDLIQERKTLDRNEK